MHHVHLESSHLNLCLVLLGPPGQHKVTRVTHAEEKDYVIGYFLDKNRQKYLERGQSRFGESTHSKEGPPPLRFTHFEKKLSL